MYSYCWTAGDQLHWALQQLSAYYDRFRMQLSSSNGHKVQLLMRIVNQLLRIVCPTPPGGSDAPKQASNGAIHTMQPSGPPKNGEQGGQAGPSKPSNDAAGGATSTAEAARVTTVNEFLFSSRLDNVNLFPLLTWMKETKLLFKVTYEAHLMHFSPSA